MKYTKTNLGRKKSNFKKTIGYFIAGFTTSFSIWNIRYYDVFNEIVKKTRDYFIVDKIDINNNEIIYSGYNNIPGEWNGKEWNFYEKFDISDILLKESFPGIVGVFTNIKKLKKTASFFAGYSLGKILEIVKLMSIKYKLMAEDIEGNLYEKTKTLLDVSIIEHNTAGTSPLSLLPAVVGAVAGGYKITKDIYDYLKKKNPMSIEGYRELADKLE